jgi:hypothetical protein
MPRKEQLAISRLRTRYTRAIHGPKMEGVSNPLCLFCNTYLSVDHILWECKDTEDQRMNMDMRKEKWINEKKVKFLEILFFLLKLLKFLKKT